LDFAPLPSTAAFDPSVDEAFSPLPLSLLYSGVPLSTFVHSVMTSAAQHLAVSRVEAKQAHLLVCLGTLDWPYMVDFQAAGHYAALLAGVVCPCLQA
ncbi:MAG: hypothetical protein LUI09_01445, partial [Prevotellaceae bacterium]|nr:hypothetical protein [Prevotellaceae bacterium]